MADALAILIIAIMCALVVLVPILALRAVTKPRRRWVAQPPTSAPSWRQLEGRIASGRTSYSMRGVAPRHDDTTIVVAPEPPIPAPYGGE